MLYLAANMAVLLPLVQVGYSYWVSVAVFASAVSLIRMRALVLHAAAHHFTLRALAVLAMYPSLMLDGDAGLQDFLRTSREALFFLIMTGFMPVVGRRFSVKETSAAVWIAVAVSAAMLSMAVAQAFLYTRQIYFGIPNEFYSTETGTVATELDLKFTDLRPSGTFTEPSYLGFFCLTMLFMFTPMLMKDKRVYAIFGINIAAMLVSGSASAVLFMMFYLFVYFSSRIKLLANRIAFMSGAAALGVAGIAVLGGRLAERLMNMGDENTETSGFVRIFQPLTTLPEFLWNHPFGLPFGTLIGVGTEEMQSGQWTEILHNGWINLFFNYGVLAIPIVVAFFIATGNRMMFLYILLAGLQNGGILAIDKVAVFLFAAHVHNSLLARFAAASPADGTSVQALAVKPA